MRLSLNALWWLAYPVMCIPFIRLWGGVYALIILLALFLLISSPFRNATLVLLFLHGYQLFICLIASHDLTQVMELNSSLMIQTAASLLVMGLFSEKGVKHALFIAAAISLTALAGLLLEIVSFDVQSVLPSKYHEADSFTPGSVLYSGRDIRFRGVFPEASALGAVCGGLTVACSLPILIARRTPPARIGIISIIIISSSIIALFLSLTKAGLFMILAGTLAALFGALVLSKYIFSPRLIAAIFSVFFLIGILFVFLPSVIKDYILLEFDSFDTLLSGGTEHYVSGKGMFGRSEGYQIALMSLVKYPFGTAPSNVESLISVYNINIGKELSYFFGNGVYGLKNFISNLIVTSGFVGLTTYFVFFRLVCKVLLEDFNSNILYRYFLVGVALFSGLSFATIIEERYFVIAYAILLIGLASYYSRFLLPK